MPDYHPVLLAAQWDIGNTRLKLTFDVPMLTVPIDGTNLTLQANGWFQSLIFFSWSHDTILRFDGLAKPDPTILNTVSYTADEITIMSDIGIPCERFTDFPVIVVP